MAYYWIALVVMLLLAVGGAAYFLKTPEPAPGPEDTGPRWSEWGECT